MVHLLVLDEFVCDWMYTSLRSAGLDHPFDSSSRLRDGLWIGLSLQEFPLFSSEEACAF